MPAPLWNELLASPPKRGKWPGIMTDSPATRLLIAAAPVLFVLMWATGFVVARLSAPHADPLTFLGIRFPIAGVLFALIALALAAPWPGAKQAFHATVAGAFLHGGYLGPVYWAVAHGMPAGVSALIVGLQPLMTAIIAAAMVKEEISLRHWAGLAVGILGVALVVSPKLAAGAHGRHHAAHHRRQSFWARCRSPSARSTRSASRPRSTSQAAAPGNMWGRASP